MASILVFYATDDAADQKRFEDEWLTFDKTTSWFGTPERIGPSAVRLPSANVNTIKIQNLRRHLRTGILRWITVEDDDIQEVRL